MEHVKHVKCARTLGLALLLRAQRDGLARRSSGGATSGISSFCITACGVAGLEPWDLYDRGRVLVDNIVLTTVPSGTYIIVR